MMMFDSRDSNARSSLYARPGSTRQPVHCDTPYQVTPPLYTAFVALQDVTMEMGPTMFVPKSVRGKERAEFDSRDSERKNAMFSKCDSKYALLKAGDVSIFDMRLLHAGNANRLVTGSTRYFLNFTFRNPRANNFNLGHEPCIRPGYKGQLTLNDIRDELATDHPFDRLGDGLQ